MRVETIKVKCNKRVFTCAEFRFDYESNSDDKKLLDGLFSEGEKLAASVNPTLARDASVVRRYERIVSNCVAGMVSEYGWRYWLNSEANRLNLNVSVMSTVFQSQNNQIDISMTYPDGTSKTAEVRSSFPYTGLQNAVCRVFDIIGWYVNPVKIREIKKDYYVRVLYPFDVTDFFNELRSDSLLVYLTGGATRNLLESGPHSRNKNFIPYDDIDAQLSSQSGVYRVIEPIINAYDTDKITDCILRGK